jgi:O-antigen/teichoic acid export membrane protein
MGRTSAVGSFHLFLGKTVSTVIMAVGTIIMGAIILDNDYGLYTISMILATTMLLFQDWGVSSAVTRECARCRASNNGKNLRRILISSLTFELATGVVLTVISLLISSFIATTVFNKPNATFLLVFASINILSTAVYTITHSILIGFEKMKLISAVLIIQGAVQCVLGPALVVLGFGAFGALAGYTVASIAAGLLSFALVYFSIFRGLEKEKVSRSDLSETLKSLLKFGIPLAIGSIMAGLLLQFSSFMMASYVTDLAVIGNYKVATNFAILLSFFSSPIIVVLFPAFSKLNPRSEPQVTKSVFQSSIKFSALFIVPATMAMFVLSNPLIGTLYGSKWPLASVFLILSVASNLLVAFGTLSAGNFLAALGHTRFAMALSLITLSIGVPLAVVLIPSIGITGMLIGSLISGIPSLFIGLFFVWKKYGAKIDFNASAKIFFSASLAALAVYIFVTFIPTANVMKLAVGLTLFLAVYLVCTPMVGAVNGADINILKAMFKDLGLASKIIEIPINLMEKVLLHFPRQKEIKLEESDLYR